MKISTAPSMFSADVISLILMHVGVKAKDLTFLWATCRVVSRDFKNAVEHVFETRHLKRTFLKMDGGACSNFDVLIAWCFEFWS